MTAIFKPSGVLVMLFLACCMLALLYLIGPALTQIIGTLDLEAPPVVDTPPLTLGELAGLPLTQHAASDHPERGMNAEAIRQSMLSGRCSPVEMWVCEAELVLLCAATESKTAGLKLQLFVGRNVRQIITGYPTTRPATAGCSGPVLLP